MIYTDILSARRDAICWISLNRPHVLNALSPRLVIELKHAFEEAAKEDEVGVIILSGEGRAFSAGVDLKQMNESIRGGKFSQDEILQAGLKLIENIQTMPKVCIAMVHGHCYTGALELALAFDLLYVSEDCRLGDTHAKWGILPKWGMTQRLPQKVGIMKAREMSFTAKTISGKEAEEYGLANKALPAEKLKEYVDGIANDILRNSRQTIAAFKHLYYQASHAALREGLKLELQFDAEITDRAEFLKEFLRNK
ncbi:MAG TPA: enoyl-CoA hydratase/isomerase family protein [Chitinophagales bacterium]|nr:enoyl-CoA hydratase/isomerase family protein [Chitinophagales bacterium]